jgi:exosortase
MARTIIWMGFCVSLALVNLPVVRELAVLSRRDASASHLVLIPFVTLALLFYDRRAIFSSVRFESLAGGIVSAISVLVMLLLRKKGQASLSGHGLMAAMTGIVLLWAGGFLVVYGRQAFRRALFPLAFLLFVVPIPDAALASTVALLKRGSSETVAALFMLTGTPFHREGYVYALPNVVIEIADECSGIRSTIALFLTSLLAGHMYLKSPWRKAVLVTAILPVTVLKNGVRIVTLSLLAIHVDPGFLTGQLHHDGGIVFFVMTLTILFPLFAWLYRSDMERSAGYEPVEVVRPSSPPCPNSEVLCQNK